MFLSVQHLRAQISMITHMLFCFKCSMLFCWVCYSIFLPQNWSTGSSDKNEVKIWTGVLILLYFCSSLLLLGQPLFLSVLTHQNQSSYLFIYSDKQASKSWYLGRKNFLILVLWPSFSVSMSLSIFCLKVKVHVIGNRMLVTIFSSHCASPAWTWVVSQTGSFLFLCTCVEPSVVTE